jgi:hypothetical protein
MIANVYPPGVYTFLYDKDRQSTDIDFVDTDNTGGASDVKTWPSSNGRAGLLHLDDEEGADIVDIYHEGFDITTTGAIEFIFYPDSACNFHIDLRDGATQLIEFILDGSNYDIDYDRGAGAVEIYNGSAKAWYIISIRIDIDAGSNGQFDCYVYDNDYTALANVTGIEFENNATTVDKIRIYSEAAETGNFFFDAFGITAEGGYTQGDIQYVGRDVAPYMEDTRITDGMLPHKKFYTFTTHPDYQAYFNENDFVDITDDSGNILFLGLILSKEEDQIGSIYHFKCDGLSNEVFDRTYDKSYSADDTDTKLKDLIDNGLQHVYRSSSIVGTTTTYDYEYNRKCAYLFYLSRFLERQVCYIEPEGKAVTTAYNGLTATGKSWTLYDGNQNAYLIDKFFKYGYSKGNTGITSASVRYINDTQVTRPASPSETFRQKRLNEFRDPKIQASTEANQLGDNLYNIFSADTIFLNMRVEGEGWLQPGETIEIESAHQITITKDDFLIVSVVYDPKNDVYISMILTDNIITRSEFTTALDTSPQQIHTAILQASENQATFVAQHNREIMPSLPPIPSSGLTAGANNCYWASGLTVYGTTSRTGGSYSRMFFRLPSDYVSGGDFTFAWTWQFDAGAGADTLDYVLKVYRQPDNAANVLEQTTDLTKVGVAGGLNNDETVTVTGTNFSASEGIQVLFYCEDDSNNHNTYLMRVFLIVPVNTRV